MRTSICGLAVIALVALLSGVAGGFAEDGAQPAASPASLPLPPGFVPAYEIMRRLRAAGFNPLAPPLREGTTYVVRATDFRGILLRVAVDARTGAIRDANRIAPGPDSDAQLGMMPPDQPPSAEPPADVATRGGDRAAASMQSHLDGSGPSRAARVPPPHQRSTARTVRHSRFAADHAAPARPPAAAASNAARAAAPPRASPALPPLND